MDGVATQIFPRVRGEFQPIAPGDSEAARAQNRRIELKFTEK